MAPQISKQTWILLTSLLLLLSLPLTSSTPHQHHPLTDIRRRSLPPNPGPPRKRDVGIPLVINNKCREALWPATETQAGTGPGTGGFLLAPGTRRNLTVGADWAGRVWGRTNCSFNAEGTASSRGSGPACETGDCAGLMSCAGPGHAPATLAEWTLAGGATGQQTFFDISLVDGYNLPLGLTYIPGSNASLQEIPPNLTSPACIATAGLLIPPAVSGMLLNASNTSYPIPYESTQSSADVAKWCPWDLQLHPPERPGHGIFPYPVDNIVRPIFAPCLSACAKTNTDSDCCTGAFNDPRSCKPGLYSSKAKRVCPDAYSYAYDDSSSTFILPTGGGWEVTFCPPGRSTNILRTFGAQMQALSQAGHSVIQLQTDAANMTIIDEGGKESVGKKSRGERMGGASLTALVVLVGVVMLW